jgi:hypothetical protein
MSMLHCLFKDKSLRGLLLKLRIGEVVRIRHESGDELLLQVVTLWSGAQVTIVFQADRTKFKIKFDDEDGAA